MVRPTRTFFILFLSLTIFQITNGRTVKPVLTNLDDSAEDAESRINLLALTKHHSENLESAIKKCDLSELLTKLRDEMKSMTTSKEITYKKDVFSLLADIKKALTGDDDTEIVSVEITKQEFAPSEHVKIDLSGVINIPDQPAVFIQEEANFDVQCDPLQHDDVSNIEDILHMILTEFNQPTRYMADITTPDNFQMFLSQLTYIMSFWSNIPKTQLYYILSQHSISYYKDWINRLLSPTNAYSPLIANFNVQKSLKKKLSSFIARWINKPQQEVIHIIATEPNSYICSLLNELLSNTYEANRLDVIPNEDKFLNFKNNLATLISQWTGILYSNVFYNLSQIPNIKLIHWVYELLQPYNQFTTNTKPVPVQVKILLARHIAYLLNILEQPVFQKLNAQPDYYIITMIHKLLETNDYLTSVVPTSSELNINVKLSLSEFKQKLLEFLSYCIKPINNINYNYDLQSFPISFWDSWVQKLLQHPTFAPVYVPQNSVMGISKECLVELSNLISSWTGNDEAEIYNIISQQDNTYLMNIFYELFSPKSRDSVVQTIFASEQSMPSIYETKYFSPSIQEQSKYTDFGQHPLLETLGLIHISSENTDETIFVKVPEHEGIQVLPEHQYVNMVHMQGQPNIVEVSEVQEPEDIVKVSEQSTIVHISNVPSVDSQQELIEFTEPQQTVIINVPQVHDINENDNQIIVQIPQEEISVQQTDSDFLDFQEPKIPEIELIPTEEQSQIVQIIKTSENPTMFEISNFEQPSIEQNPGVIHILETSQQTVVQSSDEPTIIEVIEVKEPSQDIVHISNFEQPSIEQHPGVIHILKTSQQTVVQSSDEPTIIEVIEVEKPSQNFVQIVDTPQIPIIQVDGNEFTPAVQQQNIIIDINEIGATEQQTVVQIPVTGQQPSLVEIIEVEQPNIEHIPEFVRVVETPAELTPVVEQQPIIIEINDVEQPHIVHSPNFVQIEETAQQTVTGQQSSFVEVTEVQQPNIEHIPEFVRVVETSAGITPVIEQQPTIIEIKEYGQPNIDQDQEMILIEKTPHQTLIQVPDIEDQQNFEYVDINQIQSLEQHLIHIPQTTQQTFMLFPDVEDQQNFEYINVNQVPSLGQHLGHIPQTTQQTFILVPDVEMQENYEYVDVNQVSSLGQHLVHIPQTTQQTCIQVPDVEGQQNFEYVDVNQVPSLEHLVQIPQEEIKEITIDGFTFILSSENKLKLKVIIKILTGNSNVFDSDICTFFTQYKGTPTIGMVYNLLQRNIPIYSDERPEVVVIPEQPKIVYQHPPNLVINDEQPEIVQISEESHILYQHPSNLIIDDEQPELVQISEQPQIIYEHPSNLVTDDEQSEIVQISELPNIVYQPNLVINSEQPKLVHISEQSEIIYQHPPDLVIKTEQPELVQISEQPQIVYQHPSNFIINDEQTELMQISEQPEIVYQHPPNLVINDEQPEHMQISEQTEIIYQQPSDLVIDGEQPELVQISEEPQIVYQHPSDLVINSEQHELVQISEQPSILVTDSEQPALVQISEQPQFGYKHPSNLVTNGEQHELVQISEQPSILFTDGEQPAIVQISEQTEVVHQQPSNFVIDGEQPELIEIPEHPPILVIDGEQTELVQNSEQSQIIYQHPQNVVIDGEHPELVQIYDQPENVYHHSSNLVIDGEQPELVQISEQPQFIYPSDLVTTDEESHIIYQHPSNILNINDEQAKVVQISEEPHIVYQHPSDLLHIVGEQSDLVQISEQPKIFNQPPANLLNVLNQHSEQDLLNWIQHVLQLDAINGPLNDISTNNCEEITVDGFTFTLTPVNKLKLKRIIEILTGNANVSESDIQNFFLQYKGTPMIAMIYKLLHTNSSMNSDGEHVIVLKHQLTQLISLLTGVSQDIIYGHLSQTDPSQLPALLNQIIQISSNRLVSSQNQSLESLLDGCDLLQSLRQMFPEINIQYLNNLILKTITKFLDKLSINASLASEEISLAASGENSPELVISNIYPTSSSLLLKKSHQNNIGIHSPVYNWVNRYGNYLRNPVQQVPSSVPNAFKQLFGNQVLI